MRRWLVVVAVVMSGCGPKRFPTVYLPPTSEAQACNRECMQIFNACASAPPAYFWNGYGMVPVARTGHCGGQHHQCLMSCPGAMTKEQMDEALAPTAEVSRGTGDGTEPISPDSSAHE